MDTQEGFRRLCQQDFSMGLGSVLFDPLPKRTQRRVWELTAYKWARARCKDIRESGAGTPRQREAGWMLELKAASVSVAHSQAPFVCA